MINSNPKRLHVVDAIRGFAIVAIMLLHNIEHFDFYYSPENLPSWMVLLDQYIWNTMFFLFGNKSYSIFALLFGLTFFIQSHNQKKKGKKFNGRFAWRMLLLFGFGLLNSLFFQGDILTIYAVLGLFLIPFSYLNNRALVASALILFLQPVFWWPLVQAIRNPAMQLSDPASWANFGRMGEYLSDGTLWEAMKGNITNGKTAVVLWTWENGRYFSIVGLFLLGLVAGRKGLFKSTPEAKAFWKKGLPVSVVAWAVLYAFNLYIPEQIESDAIKQSFVNITFMWPHLAFTGIWVSGIYLLFHSDFMHKALNLFAPIGKMSLSNYVIQSIIGASIYHGFGLGLFRYTGATYSLMIGITMTLLTGMLCHYWAKRHKQGPLEIIWHRLTWLGTEKMPAVGQTIPVPGLATDRVDEKR